ncbi:hypothetical protein [Kitasatospora sp. NPDC047058]|uniref:hypothetical protein n=1 Tax=Kitasatospora sp. NPDC047058 TaxID=3155620 RepID=UPI0033D01158
MAVEDVNGSTDGGGDRFEEELVVRLGERAGEVSGTPPLAELRRAGQRRAKQRVTLQVTAAAAVLALGLGGLTQLGGGGDGGASGRPVLAAGGGSPSPFAGASLPFPVQQDTGQPIACEGPTSLRTPGWTPPASTGRPPTSSSSSSSSAMSSASSSASSSAMSSPSGGPSGPPQGSASGFPSGSPSGGPSTGSGSPSGGPATGAPSLPSRTVSPTGPDASPGWTPPVPFYETPAGRAATAVWEAGQRYPDHYFGVCANSADNKVYAMRVPGSDFDQVVLGGVHNVLVKVEFVDAVGSRRQVRELAERISQDQADWKQRGVTISYVSVAADGAGVIVRTPQAETARADIIARYGRQVAEVLPR